MNSPSFTLEEFQLAFDIQHRLEGDLDERMAKVEQGMKVCSGLSDIINQYELYRKFVELMGASVLTHGPMAAVSGAYISGLLDGYHLRSNQLSCAELERMVKP